MIKALLYKSSGTQKKIFIKFEGTNDFVEPDDLYENNERYYSNLLFSGGADSMGGAYHWVVKNRKKIIFTHIRHNNTPSISMIRNFVKKELNMPLIEIEGRFNKDANYRGCAGKTKAEMMNLNQTRTFFYLCNAIPVNYAYGVDQIFITENGPLTINPTFTESHTFTSTTNPDFIASYNGFIYKYFNDKEKINVKLPFRDITKAELMASIPDNILNRTHSCSKSSYSKASCFSCYSCYIRRLSAYAFMNFNDDLYDPEFYKLNKDVLERYHVNNEKDIFNKDISFFSHNDDANLIIDLIQFCYYILLMNEGTNDFERIQNKLKFTKRYGQIFNRCNRISSFYTNIWDLLKRFSLDIFTGLNNFFEINSEYQNGDFHIWDYYLRKINKLISKNIISEMFYEETMNRILNRGVRGNIRV